MNGFETMLFHRRSGEPSRVVGMRGMNLKGMVFDAEEDG